MHLLSLKNLNGPNQQSFRHDKPKSMKKNSSIASIYGYLAQVITLIIINTSTRRRHPYFLYRIRLDNSIRATQVRWLPLANSIQPTHAQFISACMHTHTKTDGIKHQHSE